MGSFDKTIQSEPYKPTKRERNSIPFSKSNIQHVPEDISFKGTILINSKNLKYFLNELEGLCKKYSSENGFYFEYK